MSLESRARRGYVLDESSIATGLSLALSVLHKARLRGPSRHLADAFGSLTGENYCILRRVHCSELF